MGTRPDTGEADARDALAERLDTEFRGPLMRFFLRRVADRADAEDLTQETFVHLLAHARREMIDDVGAFVFRIAINLLRDRGRKATRRANARISDIDYNRVSELTREFVEERTPERVLMGRAEISEVACVLSELNERTRDIYVLFRLENMKQREIAALYGISQSTVEKEVMRATLHIASRLKRTGK